MFVAYALLPPAEVGLIGSYLQSTFRAEFDVNIPWWLIGLVPAGADDRSSASRASAPRCAPRWCCSRSRSRIVVLLAIIVVGKGGHSGLTLHPLTPGASPNGFHGLTTGFVFAALSFVGFEAATTLGDEVREPRRIVPRAVLLERAPASALLYVFCIWAEVVGLGAAEDQRARRRRRRPWNDLAATYASWMKWPVIVASVSSMFAVMINSSNGIVRILNTMGREGLLPRTFAVHRPASA